MGEPKSPFFEGVVYKSFALQKTKKVLRLEANRLTYRKDDDEEAPEGVMRLSSTSVVTATQNHYRKRQGESLCSTKRGAGGVNEIS
jgi:hypothetical protein